LVDASLAIQIAFLVVVALGQKVAVEDILTASFVGMDARLGIDARA
jgi:hypothetical protein